MDWRDKIDKRLILIAHRGDTNSHEENTVAAFISAFEKGADGVEMDIHWFDNEIIVVHDYLLDRDKTYPTLREVLGTIHALGRIEVELKSFNTGILAPLQEILIEYPQTDFELTTSEIPLCAHIQKKFPKTMIGLIMPARFFEDWMTPQLVEEKVIGWSGMANANCVHLPLTVISQFGEDSLVSRLHKAGLTVHTHILRSGLEHQQLTNIKKWGVDQCTFDDIDLLKM